MDSGATPADRETLRAHGVRLLSYLGDEVYFASVEERIDVHLTENFAMTPAASVSGLYFGHPEARYFADRRVALVATDTWGLEVLTDPVVEAVFPVHQELIVKRGIYILENMVTEELVADEAWEFLFVLGPARFKGAVQAVINPVAIR